MHFDKMVRDVRQMYGLDPEPPIVEVVFDDPPAETTGDETPVADALSIDINATTELPTRFLQAGASYEWVCKEQPDLIPDRKRSWYCKEQWEYIRDHDCPAYRDGEAPAEYRTWVKYLTTWRRAKDGPMATPRAGRSHGSSIIPVKLS